MNNPRLSTMNGTTVSDQAATSRLLYESNAVARFANGPAMATSMARPGPYGIRVRTCPAQMSSTIGCTGTRSASDISTWPASWMATAAARQPHHSRAVFAPSAIVPGVNSPSANRMTRRPISRYGHDWPTEIGILPRRATVNGLPAGDVSMITGDSSSSHMIPDRRAERDAAGGRAAELAQPGSAAERGVDRGLAIAQDRLAPGDEVVGHLLPRRDLAQRAVAPYVRSRRLHGLVAHAHRVEPDRAAGRQRPRHVVALSDQRGAGHSELPHATGARDLPHDRARRGRRGRRDREVGGSGRMAQRRAARDPGGDEDGLRPHLPAPADPGRSPDRDRHRARPLIQAEQVRRLAPLRRRVRRGDQGSCGMRRNRP